jgi:hypothetical protein
MNSDLGLLREFGAKLGRRVGESDEQLRDRLIGSLCKVRTKKKKLALLTPNRAQQEYSRRCTRRNIVLKARQLGITTYVAARFFVQTITQPGTTTVQVAHSQESAEEIFQIVRRFRENLPESVQKGALVTSRANVRQIVMPKIDSEYRVATAADLNAGRGMTIHNLHCSEVARWPRNGAETLTSLRAAVPEEGEIVLESTPNGAGGFFYDEWMRADETGYTRHFFPWWFGEGYEDRAAELSPDSYTDEQRKLAETHGLSAAQIAWRRNNRAQHRALAAQEFAEDADTCFLASGECIFDLEAIEESLRECGEPVEAHDNGRMLMWLPPHGDKQYIVGVDPAGGGSEGDYSCAQVIERRTAMQCAELHGHFSPRELANRLVALGDAYNGALLAVERNNHGYGVLAHLRALEYRNVYQEGGQEGWLTSAVSRPAMIENLAAVLVLAPKLFRSRRFLQECRTFVRHLDGSSGATSGTHDDCVMAMGVAMAVRKAVAGKAPRFWECSFVTDSGPAVVSE